MIQHFEGIGETKREAIFAREDPVGSVEEPVREIIAQVRAKGDEALKRYTKEFDGVDITSVEVRPGEPLTRASAWPTPMLVDILYRASERVAAPFTSSRSSNSFLVNEARRHSASARRSSPWSGWASTSPAARPPTPPRVLMNCIPAKMAGVQRDRHGHAPRQRTARSPRQYLGRRPDLRASTASSAWAGPRP